MPGQHNPGHPGALGAAQQSAQVAGVGDAGRDQEEGRGGPGGGRAHLLERHRVNRPGQSQHPLGGLGPGLGVEPGVGHGLEGNAQFGGQCLNPIELGRGILVLGHEDASDAAARCGQQLEHGLTALDLVAAQLADRLGPGTPVGRLAAGTGPRPAHAGAGPINTTARHASPSARPRAPRPSARVAFTDTGAPSSSLRRWVMASV